MSLRCSASELSVTGQKATVGEPPSSSLSLLEALGQTGEFFVILLLTTVSRFYLGHWQEGIGKLFSFGGLGVWTLVDVVLVAIGYIGAADGSLYI